MSREGDDEACVAHDGNADEAAWLDAIAGAARATWKRDGDDLGAMKASREGRALLAPLDEDAAARIDAAVSSGVLGASGATRPKVLGRVTSRTGWLTRRAAPAGLALALAASVALFVGRTSTGGDVPGYELAISGGTSVTREAPARVSSGDGVVTELAAGGRFELVATPQEATGNEIAARAFLVDARGTRPWDAPIALSKSGAARVEGETSRLFAGVTGEVEVVLAVGRRGALPDADAIAGVLAGAKPDADANTRGYRVLRVRVRLVP